MFKVNRSVCIDKSDSNGLLNTRINGFVIIVPNPFKASKDCSGIFSSLEGCIIKVESWARLEFVNNTFRIRLRVEDWISGLVATFPVIRNTTHVRVSGMIDCCDEPLVVAFAHVCDLLTCVFSIVCNTVSVDIMICFNPIFEREFHWNTDCVTYQNADILIVDSSFI